MLAFPLKSVDGAFPKGLYCTPVGKWFCRQSLQWVLPVRSQVLISTLACAAWTVAVPAALNAADLPVTPAADGEKPAARLTVEQLDALIQKQPGAAQQEVSQDDRGFLRRLSFDLIGRQPTLAEQQQFADESSDDKYDAAVDRLLASREFGENWANYWSDTIAYRVPPPELTYLNYKPLKHWLTKNFNVNTPWNQVVHELLTAKGKVDEVPAATFVGYHAGNATNLASETSRIFLGQQIGCAQCHDHPFDSWERRQFHEMAAFFARAKSKLSQNDGGGTVVTSAEKGEYLMPDMDDPRKKGSQMTPSFLDGDSLDKGESDERRRAELAAWVTGRENPWFAKAFVNRIWARTMGRGFYEPVDDLGESQSPVWTDVHEALTGHFKATGYDVKDLFRLIATSDAYRRGVRTVDTDLPADQTPLRLRGDEVFAALAVGIELPNIVPPKVEPTGAIRFPPPPKSTRDLVNDVFGADPSFSAVDAPRTMAQALWMMNNEQLQAQIDASPESDTMLARLLAEETDDRAACRVLYERVLARKPTDDELRVACEHVESLGDRGAAFEDLLWSLVNSAEFTTRR
ncbi:MAG: DUF1549 domain-containing protein [Planctomycetota bacterium]|nr:MAG: DUF1549 domain-containing protein [Planctomycetota bacterium]